jgi:hypothetical protein
MAMRKDEQEPERVDISATFDPRVDLSQLRMNLRRTYAERLAYAVSSANNVRRMVEYARQHKK